MKLQDARVVLTGATGGIGQELLEQLLTAGAQVLSKVTVREDVVLRAPTHKGWAVRKGSAQAWPRSGSLVQSCRGRDGREDRHGNDDLCAQHLQV